MRHLIVVLFAGLAGGCGALSTPVSLVGDLSGRIVGASPGAYAYPLGRPDLKTPVKVDGTWSLEDVPTSVTAIVLWDGADRAELVPVAVAPGAKIEIADRYGAAAAIEAALQMPLAGALLAGVDPEGGAIPWAPSFSVHGTDHADVRPLSGGHETIYPLPAGPFVVEASLDGFAPTSVSIAIVAGVTSASELALPIDAGAAAPGCGSAPGCENGLVCEPGDGRCYVCTAADASACGAGGTCDAAAGLCAPTAGSPGALCAACAADADCASGACAIPDGASAGWCVAPCAGDPDCPSGFKCGDGGRCRAPHGCLEWMRTMGSACVGSSSCEAGLADGRCATPDPAVEGYCTARCAADADCRIGSGIAATMVCAATGFCALP